MRTIVTNGVLICAVAALGICAVLLYDGDAPKQDSETSSDQQPDFVNENPDSSTSIQPADALFETPSTESDLLKAFLLAASQRDDLELSRLKSMIIRDSDTYFQEVVLLYFSLAAENPDFTAELRYTMSELGSLLRALAPAHILCGHVLGYMEQEWPQEDQLSRVKAEEWYRYQGIKPGKYSIQEESSMVERAGVFLLAQLARQESQAGNPVIPDTLLVKVVSDLPKTCADPWLEHYLVHLTAYRGSPTVIELARSIVANDYTERLRTFALGFVPVDPESSEPEAVLSSESDFVTYFTRLGLSEDYKELAPTALKRAVDTLGPSGGANAYVLARLHSDLTVKTDRSYYLNDWRALCNGLLSYESGAPEGYAAIWILGEVGNAYAHANRADNGTGPRPLGGSRLTDELRDKLLVYLLAPDKPQWFQAIRVVNVVIDCEDDLRGINDALGYFSAALKLDTRSNAADIDEFSSVTSKLYALVRHVEEDDDMRLPGGLAHISDLAEWSATNAVENIKQDGIVHHEHLFAIYYGLYVANALGDHSAYWRGKSRTEEVRQAIERAPKPGMLNDYVNWILKED